jgi:hypothetical protein
MDTDLTFFQLNAELDRRARAHPTVDLRNISVWMLTDLMGAVTDYANGSHRSLADLIAAARKAS